MGKGGLAGGRPARRNHQTGYALSLADQVLGLDSRYVAAQ